MVTKVFLRNKSTGAEFEIIELDKEAGTCKLKGEYGEFTETYDRQKFLEMGYERVKREVPDEEDADA